MRRLTDLRWVLLGLQQQFLAKEGIGHRGPAFGKLVSAVDAVRRDEPPVTEVEALDLLGPPDYADFDWRGGEYVYTYADENAVDHVAFVMVGAGGAVDTVGFNVKSGIDLHGLTPYRAYPAELFRGLRPVSRPSVKAYLGIGVRKLKSVPGIIVAEVVPGSPASNADIRPGDIILRLNDKSVEDDDAPGFFARTALFEPGQVVSLTWELMANV